MKIKRKIVEIPGTQFITKIAVDHLFNDDDKETPIFDMHERPTRWESILGGKASLVFALTTEGKMLLAEELRTSVNFRTLEFPGGVLDEGEDFVTAAKRELLEEAGYEAESMKKICAGYYQPAVSNHAYQIFFAKNCRKIKEPSPEVVERLMGFRIVEKSLVDIVEDRIRGNPAYESQIFEVLLLLSYMGEITI